MVKEMRVAPLRSGHRSAGPATMLARGECVGRYVILSYLGHGGMGVVYAAYDPELDRRVALKLLLPQAEGGLDGSGRARLLREAQALARLAHPNVVGVHDLGVHDERVWISMEFIAGQTLAMWAQQPRRWPEVLQRLVDAARGVAAAHAAGLVHRDLKPDNVMIDAHGRVRVMDFGLAHGRARAAHDTETAPTLESDALSRPASEALTLRLTQAGALYGTPSYMAPEQWQGDEAGTAADQFGWCVMAWEMLYGERPFVGADAAELAARVIAGERRPPPRGRRIPGWVRRVLERGLSPQPAHRWPTMDALLAVLHHGRTRARMRMAAAAIVGIAALGAGIEGARRWDVAKRVAQCEAVGANIDDTWNDGSRERLQRSFAATRSALAPAVTEKVLPRLDQHVAAWKRSRTELCLDTTVHGTQDPATLGRALWCLDSHRMALEAILDEWSRADTAVMLTAAYGAQRLAAVSECLDEQHLRRQPELPEVGHREAGELQSALSRVLALELVGKYKEALQIARQARAQAERLDWRPLVVTARYHEARMLQETDAFAESEAALTATYFEAVRAGMWDLASSAATGLIAVVGGRPGRQEEGLAWARHAEAVAAYAGDPEGAAEASRLGNLGYIYSRMGRYPEALASAERSLALSERSLGPEHPDIVRNLLGLAHKHRFMAHYKEADELFARALAIQEKALGPDTPEVASTLTGLAYLRGSIGAHAEAVLLLERALDLQTRALGPYHSEVAYTLQALGFLYLQSGNPGKGRAVVQRSIDILERVDLRHPRLGDLLDLLVGAHVALEDYPAALAAARRALSLRMETLGPEHQEIAVSLNNLAALNLDMGDSAEARRLSERALAIEVKTLGPEHPQHANSLMVRARAHIAEGELEAAVSVLERAVAIFEAHAGVQQGELSTRFLLAETLIESGGDRARALAEAEKAREGFDEAGRTDKSAEVAAWLAEQRGPTPRRAAIIRPTRAAQNPEP